MKRLFCALIVIVIHFQATSQSINIPEEIKYKETDELTNKKAIEKIKIELQEPQYSSLKNIFYCGPSLWERYILIPDVGSIQKGNITFKVPYNGDFIDKNGKLIQSQSDYQLIWNQIVKDFNNSEFIIRKPTPDELQVFWSIIFYDIEEPIFVIENNSYKVIIDLDSDLKIQFIDQLN